MINDSVKKSEETLIKKFYMHDTKFPCFLKENGEKGDLIEYTGAFEDISFEKYHPHKENTFKKQEFNSDLSSKNIYKLDFDSFMNVAIFHSEGAVLRGIDNIRSLKKKHFVAKKILYSISLDPDSIHFKSFIIDALEEIANSYLNDNKKAQELDNFFKNYGFFIPLKMYIGGMFSFEEKVSSNSKSKNSLKKANSKVEDGFGNFNANFSDSFMDDLNELYINHCLNIKGGDINKKSFDEWEKTITLNNSVIIGYDNLIQVKEFIPVALRKKLSAPLEIVNQKYQAIKEYYHILEMANEGIDFCELSGKKDISKGFCEKKTYPLIYEKKYEVKGDGRFFKKREDNICGGFGEDIIVGFSIKSCWTDGTNGMWKIIKNPLLKRGCDIKFVSQRFRGQRFQVILYLMQFPKINNNS